MTITTDTTVADIASAIPSSVPIFERLGIDYCCGGRTPLGSACTDRGISFDELALAIEHVRESGPVEERNWTGSTLSDLIGHIVTTYHHRHREELPRLQTWARRAAAAHGAKHPGVFDTLERVLMALATELADHMNKEERVLFPAICAREQGEFTPTIPFSSVIDVLEREHDHAGSLLAELRQLTGGYEPPTWACATVSALYRGLAEFETALHLHVHLENNVLFTQAVALPQPTYWP